MLWPCLRWGIDPSYGRSGSLTDREFAMAQTAWSYFETSYQPETGLINSVAAFPSTTLWDTAPYVSTLVAAYGLCVIAKRESDSRATKPISTLRNLKLYRKEAQNKVYSVATREMVDYANKPGEIIMSANDIGRFLVWLKIAKKRRPYLANSVLMRWNFCNMINEDGRMFGSLTQSDGTTRYVQAGRLGYEEYAAKGFALWGFDAARAMAPQPLEFTTTFDVKVP